MKIIGIDPGAHTGMALFNAGTLAELWTIHPCDVADYLASIKPHRVVFEDSRLQSFTWTTVKNRAQALKIARNIGEVDAWCRLITVACERLEIPALSISPKNKGAKMDHDSFCEMARWATKTNQHERDAAMVAWPFRRMSHG